MRYIGLTIVLSLLAWVVAPAHRPARAERIPLVVVAHPGLKASTVHASELRAIYLRQSEQLEGQRVIPLNYAAGNPLRVDFDARVLGMSQDDSGRYWVDARIRGLGSPPRSVSGVQLLLRTVAALPGAIGYVPKNMVTSGVKQLHVDGLSRPL